MQTTAIIVAAGAGVRMGTRRPKAFLDLAGRPMVEHSLRTFQDHERVTAIVLMVPPGMEDDARSLAVPFPKVAAVTGGGARRQDTVVMGLRAARALAGPGGGESLVLVHDAARPLVPAGLITAVLDAAARTGASFPGLAPCDTIREVLAGSPESAVLAGRTMPRERLVMVQTPQGFRMAVLERAHAAAGDQAVSDDAALVLALGEPVEVVPGSERNFKITSAHDLQRASALLAV
jgi:2-C-methyl-D-erythritol 4-phosphate cytidylyltransferase